MIDVISLFITGLIKFPGLVGFFGIRFGDLPIGTISGIHDWSGIILIILVFLHLILHWSSLKAMTKRIFK
jgi:hypothetical protein